MQYPRLLSVALVFVGLVRVASADGSGEPIASSSDVPTALVVYGDADQDDRALVASVFLSVFRGVPWVIDDKSESFTRSDIEHLYACTGENHPGPCASVILRPRQIRRIVFIEVTPHEHEKAQRKGPGAAKETPETAIYGSIVDVGIDDIAPNESAYCPNCNDTSLRGAAENLARRLLKANDDLAINRTKAQQEPATGHQSRLGGSPIPPGSHDGAPADTIAHPWLAKHWSALTGPLVTLGGLAVIGGGIELHYNQHPWTVQPPGYQPPTYRNTEYAATALFVGGGLAIIAGGSIWLWHRHHPARLSATPSVMVIPGGASLVVSGSF